MTLTKFYKRHNGVCWICGLGIPKPGLGVESRHRDISASKDHVLITGGKSRLLLAHRICNSSRGSREKEITNELIQSLRERITRSKMKLLIEVNLHNIICSRLPINYDGFATALYIKSGGEVPPIKLQRLENGNYLLKDGRHRLLAHKLLGRKKIWARISEKGTRGK